jgi:hypothetical protein
MAGAAQSAIEGWGWTGLWPPVAGGTKGGAPASPNASRELITAKEPIVGYIYFTKLKHLISKRRK